MGKTCPYVSVIVPTFNYGVYLKDCINSVQNQIYRNIEIIIVDDGSKDNTAEVVKQLKEKDLRIKYIYQQNQGLSAARNTGIKHANGEFFIFLDADDLMHPEKVAAHLEHFSELPEIDLSYGECRYFLSENPEKTFANIELTEQQWMPKVSGRAEQLMPTLIVNNIMPVCSVMLRRSLVDNTGLFDTSLKSLEDWDYWLRASARNHYFSFRDDVRLAAYIRVHGTSMSQNSLRMLQVQYLLRRHNIPMAINSLDSFNLRRMLAKDNTKRKIKAAASMRSMLDESAFTELLSGEDWLTRLKIRAKSRKKNHR